MSTIDAFLRRARAEYLRREPIEAERTAALDLARLLGDAIRSKGTESEIREAEDALAAAIERRRA